MYKLYIGNEPFLSLREAHKYTNKIKDDGFEYINIDVEKADITTVIDTISSQNLFSKQRVILLKRVYKNRKKDDLIQFLMDYLPNLSSDRIIIWEDQKVSSITRYVKFFKKDNKLEEYNKLNRRTFLTWARDEIKEKELTLDNNLISLLSELCNFNPERFENSIKKIKLLEKENITTEDINLLSVDTLEKDIWELIDNINNSTGNQIKILEKILSQGTDPNYIISMLARNLRLVTLTKELREKGYATREIASILKIPPFTIPALINASSKYSMEKIKTLYEKLSNLDYEIKVGRIEPALGLTLFSTIL
jgi:DNA polymerase-3 subunit delta